MGDGNLDLPFNEVALSLSGGGTRAIGFHLGTLDYLHRLGLLERVRILSTVSGGSLIGTSYALSLDEGISFQDLFFDLFEFLPAVNIAEGLLEILGRREPPVAGGKRDPSTALAELYHESYFSRYFSNPTFGTIGAGLPGSRQHLEEIAFCATEFKTGIAFRFQKSRFDCKLGNGNVWIDAECGDEMRIADIVTASSCIPGAFAPLELPADFHWPATYQWGDRKGQRFAPVVLRTKSNEGAIESIALADGGVYDNQGITSVLLSIARRRSAAEGLAHEAAEINEPQVWAHWARALLVHHSGVDLFIISDTPALKDTFYADAEGDKQPSGFAAWLRNRRLIDIGRLGVATAVVLVASSLFPLARFLVGPRLEASGSAGPSTPAAIDILSMLIPLLVAGALGAGVLLIRRELIHATRALEVQMPRIRRPLRHYLQRLKLGDLWQMLRPRAQSLTALASEIYMHRIRQLGYGLAFSRDEVAPTILANEIYSLTRASGERPVLPNECLPPSPTVLAVAELSSSMRTKAWFDRLTADGIRQQLGDVDDETLSTLMTRKDGTTRTDLDVLVACGQITICYNVILHVKTKLAGANGDDTGPAAPLRALLSSACRDWNVLQAAPFSFVDERLRAGRSADHAAQIAQRHARASYRGPAQ